MAILLATAAVATAMLSHCSWNSPGRNPYRGSVLEAVSRYLDIPGPVRAELIARIEGGHADDTVAITRDSIAGKYDYSPQITGMHFGQRTLCDSVARDGWPATAREPAAVYCVGDECVIVPKICANISRVRRVRAGIGGGTQAGAPVAGLADVGQAAGFLPARAASPDDVARADAMAHLVADVPQPATLPSAAFTSPFAGVDYGARLGTPDPAMDAGTEIAYPVLVPEPATRIMFGAGLAVLAGMAWRRASRRRTARP